jgi:hypothetical protein
MYNLMGYNKDRDTYEELFIFHKLSVAELMFERLIELLKNDILKDETGETFDWLEVWNDEDDNRLEDIIISTDGVWYKKDM